MANELPIGQRNGGGLKRLLLLVLGSVSLLAGIALLALAGYDLLAGDSNPTGPRTPLVRPVYDPTPGPSETQAVQSPLGVPPYQLIIESIGVDAPVAPFGLDENAVPQVPYEGGLVAWYNFSAMPGTGGNAVFAGHYTWYGDAVFRRLGDLKPGDRVVLRGENGAELVYTVADNELVEPNIDEARRWMDPTAQDVLTLITCGGTFTWTGDEVFGGEYDKRQVVRAQLLEAHPAGAGG